MAISSSRDEVFLAGILVSLQLDLYQAEEQPRPRGETSMSTGILGNSCCAFALRTASPEGPMPRKPSLQEALTRFSKGMVAFYRTVERNSRPRHRLFEGIRYVPIENDRRGTSRRRVSRPTLYELIEKLDIAKD